MALITFDKVLKIVSTILNILVVALNSLSGLDFSKSADEDAD